MNLRLNRLLAAAGYGSRRACEELIAAGRVSVDGAITRNLGTTVDPERRDVRCDGVRVRPAEAVVYALHKPRGVICTDRGGNLPRVVDYFPKDGRRLFTVGRLDADSAGLLLVTNDGLLANRIAHPRYEVPKTYRVRVRGVMTEADVARLAGGVWLAEGRTGPFKARVIHRERDRSILLVTLREGRNREIRRVFAKFGYKVQRLTRVAIGALALGALRPGEWRRLTADEQQRLTSEQPPAEGAMAPPGSARHHHERAGTVQTPPRTPWRKRQPPRGSRPGHRRGPPRRRSR